MDNKRYKHFADGFPKVERRGTQTFIISRLLRTGYSESYFIFDYDVEPWLEGLREIGYGNCSCSNQTYNLYFILLSLTLLMMCLLNDAYMLKFYL